LFKEIFENRKIDLSIIPSLDCNIACPFCMYDSGHHQKEMLDIDKTRSFLKTVDWNRINSCGFYGGEISINLPLYQEFCNLIPKRIPKFTITNGTWSTNFERCKDFLDFIYLNDMFVVVSGTPYHKQFQNLKVLNDFKNMTPNMFRLKGDDIIHPMGRASIEHWSCSMKCKTFTVPTRLAIFPNGYIKFQNCDGQYPFIQTYNEPFEYLIDNLNRHVRFCEINRRNNDNK
jgi:hypothetical protein